MSVPAIPSRKVTAAACFGVWSFFMLAARGMVMADWVGESAADIIQDIGVIATFICWQEIRSLPKALAEAEAMLGSVRRAA